MPDALQNSGVRGRVGPAGGRGRVPPSRAEVPAPPPPPTPGVTRPNALTASSSRSPSLARSDVNVTRRRHVRSWNSESGTRAMKRAFVTVGTTSFDELVARVAAPDSVEVSPAQGSAVSAPLPFPSRRGQKEGWQLFLRFPAPCPKPP